MKEIDANVQHRNIVDAHGDCFQESAIDSMAGKTVPVHIDFRMEQPPIGYADTYKDANGNLAAKIFVQNIDPSKIKGRYAAVSCIVRAFDPIEKGINVTECEITSIGICSKHADPTADPI